MPAMTRGPLPARVYWVRRMAVLSIALLLVVGIAKLLGGGSDASSDEDQAAQVAADTSTSPSAVESSLLPTGSASSDSSQGPRKHHTGKQPGKQQTSEAPVLVDPVGQCSGSDIAVTPKIENAVAGRDVMVVLQLRTLQSPACTWHVSDDALTVKITSGADDIWSSNDCPKAIQVRDVVVRQAVTTNVGIVWKQAMRSSERCTPLAGWPMPGWYHVTASAVGGEPSDLQFELTTPTAGTVTRTADPTQSPSNG